MSDQLDKLIAGLFDQSLSPEDQRRLAELLNTSPDARARCAQACHVEGDLVRLVKTGQLDLLGSQPRSAPRTGAITRRPASRRHPAGAALAWLKIAAILALLAVPVGVVVHQRIYRASNTVHVIVQEGTVTIGPDTVIGERDLVKGTSLTVSPNSRCVLRFADSTLIELDSGTTLRVTETDVGKSIILDGGRLHARVAKQPVGHPLRVMTARSEVLVVGTQLTVSVGLVADHVDVSEGLVHCVRRTDRAAVDVAAGYATDIAAETTVGVHLLKPPPPKPPSQGLVVWYDSTKGIDLGPDGRVARWHDSSHIHQDLVVPKGLAGPHIIPDGPESRAVVRFAAHKEILAVRRSGPSGSAYTMAVLLRANELGQLSQGFGWGWGMFDFHSDARGGIHAGTGTLTIGKPDDFNRFVNGHDQLGPTIMQVGKWQRIMITCADGTGTFYMDGQLIGHKAMTMAPIAGVLCIGRGDAPPEQPYSFSGDLAELLFYNRVLDAKEREVIDQRLTRESGR